MKNPLDDIKIEDLINDSTLVFEEKFSRKEKRSPIKTTTSTTKFKIIQNFGPLSDKKNPPEFSLVDWGGYTRYDIRPWLNNYSTPGKGITFTEEEISFLKENLSSEDIKFDVKKKPERIAKTGKMRACILSTVLTLSSSTQRGILWNKQINIIDWGYGYKFDLRKWTEDYSQCSKGVSLSTDEMKVLLNFLETVIID